MRNVENSVGHGFAHFLIMEDAEQRRAFFFFLPDHVHHNAPVGGVERSRRLIEKQDRMIGDETARDVDALLLTA